jgi:hypothetical protein
MYEQVGPARQAAQRNGLRDETAAHKAPLADLFPSAVIGHQKALYDTNLVLVAIHMTEAFAAPALPLGDDSLDTDFRTPAGNTYEQTFSVPSLPKGLISRKPYNGTTTIGRANWSSAVADIIGDPADLKLWFDSFAYDAGTNQVTTTVKAVCLNAITGDHNLTVYLTEDHVIDGQIDQSANPPYVPDYEHRHVLRDNLNGAWGDPFVVGQAAVGDTLSKSFVYSLPANVLVPTNCALVAYVYSTGGADRYEVKQVQEQEFQP